MKIAVNGACGRMGKTLIRLAREEKVDVVLAIDNVPGETSEIEGVPLSSSLSVPVDVVVDFSLPQGTLERVAECREQKVPIVICTTGFSPEQQAEIESASREIPVLQATNMSVGMNLLFRIVPEIAKTLGGEYDIDVVETHHRFKKDAPSGSAKTLAERIEAETGRVVPVASLRSGDVVGEHKVVFGTLGESIEIVHRASSRDIFARGSIRAARFLSKAKPGLYHMLDAI
jgi:4-hydroxy-tetrahydrodipicolinate reductase